MRWLTMAGRRLQRSPLLIDALLVAGLSTLALIEMVQFRTSSFRSPDVWGAGLSALAVMPMLLRHRLPELSLGAVLAAGLMVSISGYDPGNYLFFGVLIGVYSVAIRGGHRRSLLALAAGALGVVAMAVAASRQLGEPTPWTDLALVVVPATAWGMGTAHRRLRENARTLEALTHRLRKERAAGERRAVLEERHRIARELHDVVAHHISAIAMQANAARVGPSGRPGGADEYLALIHTASRDALTEMRRLISVLKDADVEDPRLPLPTLADLGKLVARANEADLATELEIRGRPRELPRVLELSAYRIVQEALTNAIKHAGPATARVLVHYRPDQLDLAVNDTGPGPRASSRDAGTPRNHPRAGGPGAAAPPGGQHAGAAPGGHGLIGMRERVALFGGTLHTGPGPDGGFLVTASLPIAGGRQ